LSSLRRTVSTAAVHGLNRWARARPARRLDRLGDGGPRTPLRGAGPADPRDVWPSGEWVRWWRGDHGAGVAAVAVQGAALRGV